LRVFENWVLRRIYGPKREEVAGGRRRLHSKELCNFYTAPNIIRLILSKMMRWAGHVACMGAIRNVYNVLVGKPEGKRPLGRPRHRWEDSIRMDLGEIRWEGVDWMHLPQGRGQWRALANTIMNLFFHKRERISCTPA